MMRFDSIQVTNRDLNPPKFISLDESIESHGYNMLLMSGLSKHCLFLFLLHQKIQKKEYYCVLVWYMV